MEENSEKKKQGRHRHYRGKNRDKSDVKERQEKSGEQQPSEKGARQDRKKRQDKPDRQRERDAKPRQGRKEVHDEADTSEKPEPKAKREPEEVIYEFTWADAWGLYGTGYHVVIKDNKEHLYLMWSVDLGYGELKLGQRLQEFLDDMKDCGVAAWDGHKYTKPGIFDGDTWSIKVNSLSLKCEAQGTNEYPEEWKKMLSCLHDKWGIPVSKREQFE